MKIVYRCKCGKIVRPRVEPPPKKHEIQYYQFVDRVLSGAGIKDLPKFGKKYRRLVRVTAKYRNWFLPLARGTKFDLVPPPGVEPCALCSLAQYNHNCAKQDDCLPYAYWASTVALNLPNSGMQALKSFLLPNIREKFNFQPEQNKEKQCGATRAKYSNPSLAAKQGASAAVRPSASRRTTSSAKVRKRSSRK